MISAWSGNPRRETSVLKAHGKTEQFRGPDHSCIERNFIVCPESSVLIYITLNCASVCVFVLRWSLWVLTGKRIYLNCSLLSFFFKFLFFLHLCSFLQFLFFQVKCGWVSRHDSLGSAVAIPLHRVLEFKWRLSRQSLRSVAADRYKWFFYRGFLNQVIIFCEMLYTLLSSTAFPITDSGITAEFSCNLFQKHQ